MLPEKLTFLRWDGVPGLLAEYADHYHAWKHVGGEWVTMHVADAIYKFYIIERELFEKLDPGIGLPHELELGGTA